MANKLVSSITSGLAASAVLATPSLAHPGPHEGLSLAAIVEHFGTPYHLLPAAAVVLFGLAYVIVRARRRVPTRVASRRKEKA